MVHQAQIGEETQTHILHTPLICQGKSIRPDLQGGGNPSDPEASDIKVQKL